MSTVESTSQHLSCFEWRVSTHSFKAKPMQTSSDFFICGRPFQLYMSFRNATYRLRMKPRNFSRDPREIFLDVQAIAPGSKPVVLASRLPFSYSLMWSSRESDIHANCPGIGSARGKLIFILSGVNPFIEKPIAVETSVQTSLELKDLSCLEALSKDLSGLLKDQDSEPDVVLACGDKKVRAHSNVLCARSKVIAAELRSDLFESRTGQIKIDGMELGIFEQFVRFLYSGKLPDLTAETARDLYDAGDRFDVPSLMRQCARILEQNLTAENACGMLVLADMHCDQEFKKFVSDYIMREELIKQDDLWLPFCNSHPALANQVLNLYFKLQRDLFQIVNSI